MNPCYEEGLQFAKNLNTSYRGCRKCQEVEYICPCTNGITRSLNTLSIHDNVFV